MTDSSVVRDALSRQLGRQVDDGERLIEDLGFDSLMLLELVVAMEAHDQGFQISVMPNSMDFRGLTVQDFAHMAANWR